MICPEHEKLKLIADKSQALGEFIAEWLPQQGIYLAQYHEHDDGCYEPHVHADCTNRCKRVRNNVCGSHEGTLYPIHIPVVKLLAAYFGIDKDKLENEKRQMLDELRAQHKDSR